jgi:hypothetical protein
MKTSGCSPQRPNRRDAGNGQTCIGRPAHSEPASNSPPSYREPFGFLKAAVAILGRPGLADAICDGRGNIESGFVFGAFPALTCGVG